MSKVETHVVSESDADATLSVLMAEFSTMLQSDVLVHQHSQAWTELFRSLRNFVANSKSRQTAVIRNAFFENILKRITHITFELFRRKSETQNSSFQDQLIQLRCAVQFLGNLITGNCDNKMATWKHVVSLFSLWCGMKDVALTSFATMVMYNAILDVPSHREELLSSQDCDKITISLLDSTSGGCEWALFILENFLESPNFVVGCYQRTPDELRIALLDIMCQKLARESRPSIPDQTLEFVINEFKLKSDAVLSTKVEFHDDDLNPIQIVKYLEILCEASTKPPYQAHLQKSASLLCSLVYLLKSIHMADKQAPKSNANGEKSTSDHSSTTGKESTNCQAIGFKKNLIRLIANQCWRHRDNQDLVQQLDGIPLLLDCCKLDTQNPFITEWVIFAIRNLCEQNLKNQEVIAKMKLQNAVDPSVYSEVGIPEDKSFNIMPTMPHTSRSEQIEEEIRDLMQ